MADRGHAQVAVNPLAAYANAVPRAAAQMGALNDPGRQYNHGYIYDGAAAAVGQSMFGSDLSHMNSSISSRENPQASLLRRPQAFNTELDTFEKRMATFSNYIDNFLVVRAENSVLLSRIFPQRVVDDIDALDMTRRVITFEPGIALEQPDLGVFTLLKEHTEVHQTTGRRFAIGQMNGMWYGFTREAEEKQIYRVMQLAASFDHRLMLECFGELARVCSIANVYKYHGINNTQADPLDAYRRLTLAAASHFALTGKDPVMAAATLRSYFTRALTEVNASLDLVYGPMGTTELGKDAPILQNPGDVSQKRADDMYNDKTTAMEPLTRGVTYADAEPVPIAHKKNMHCLTHAATFGVYNAINDARRINMIPPDLYQTVAAGGQVYDFEIDAPVLLQYKDVLDAAGMFSTANVATYGATPSPSFGADTAAFGRAYLETLLEHVNALRPAAEPALAIDALTLSHLLQMNKFDTKFAEMFPEGVNNAAGDNPANGVHSVALANAGVAFTGKPMRARFTVSALRNTLVRADPAYPAFAGNEGQRAAALAAANPNIPSIQFMNGIPLRRMTLATFHLLLSCHIPVPIPFVLNRPSISADMGTILGMDTSRGGIGVAARTRPVQTVTAETRQLSAVHMNCHMKVEAIHPECVIGAFNVVPVAYNGGGGTTLVNNANPEHAAAFRTRLSARGVRNNGAQVNATMIATPVTQGELEALMSSRVLALGPEFIARGGDRGIQPTHPIPRASVHKCTFAVATIALSKFWNSNCVVMPNGGAMDNFSINGTNALNSTSTLGWQCMPELGPHGTYVYPDSSITQCQIFGPSRSDGIIASVFRGRGIPG